MTMDNEPLRTNYVKRLSLGSLVSGIVELTHGIISLEREGEDTQEKRFLLEAYKRAVNRKEFSYAKTNGNESSLVLEYFCHATLGNVIENLVYDGGSQREDLVRILDLKENDFYRENRNGSASGEIGGTLSSRVLELIDMLESTTQVSDVVRSINELESHYVKK